MKQKLNKFLKNLPGSEALIAEFFEFKTCSAVLNWTVRGVPMDKRALLDAFINQQEYSFELSESSKFWANKKKLLDALIRSGRGWEIDIWCGNAKTVISLRRGRNGDDGRRKATGPKKLARRGTNA